MDHCVIGSQDWYDRARQSLVDIGARLISGGNLTEEERDRLYDEQNRIVLELHDNWDSKLVNSQLKV